MTALRIIGWLIGFCWSLPHTALGVLLIPIYVPRRVRWRKGALEIQAKWVLGFANGASGCQTHGVIVFGTDPGALNDEEITVHERSHILQGFIGGPFYVVFYVAHFLVTWVKIGLLGSKHETPEGLGRPAWWRAYRHVIFERRARARVKRWRAGKAPGIWGS